MYVCLCVYILDLFQFSCIFHFHFIAFRILNNEATFHLNLLSANRRARLIKWILVVNHKTVRKYVEHVRKTKSCIGSGSIVNKS